MAKDPAFLFYSNDFYEGTRTLMPDERGCYIDLLIYQHQKGIIPNDPKRLTLYCSGCNAEIIQSVLNQKFTLTKKGWLNHKLNHLVNQRAKHKPKKIAAAVLAGLISKSKLSLENRQKIKKMFKIDEFLTDEKGNYLSDNEIKSSVNVWFYKESNQMVNHMVEKMVGHSVNNKIENRDININKGSIKKEKGVKGKKKTLKKEIVLVKNEIVFPWDSKAFIQAWANWIVYKKDEHNFHYKSEVTEQAAVKNLQTLCGNREDKAIFMIERSIANGWKGFFPISDNEMQKELNQSTNQNEKYNGLDEEIKRQLG